MSLGRTLSLAKDYTWRKFYEKRTDRYLNLTKFIKTGSFRLYCGLLPLITINKEGKMQKLMFVLIILNSIAAVSNTMGQIEVRDNEILEIKAKGCEPGQKPVLIFSGQNQKMEFEAESKDNPYKGNLMKNSSLVRNKFFVYTECRRLYCVLDKSSKWSLKNEYMIALESVEDNEKAQYITKSVRTKSQATGKISDLIAKGVCSHQRESYTWKGGSESFQQYDSQNPNNID